MPDPEPAAARRGAARASVGRQRLRVAVTDEQGRVAAPGLAAWLRRVAPAGARGVVNIALVSDARVRALNKRYRGKDYATDVLSFPAASEPRAARRSRAAPEARIPNPERRIPNPGPLLGDVVIARPVARRQARAAGHGEATELRVLALHGLLHLLGYDHERDDGRMLRVERRLRRKGGLRESLIERAAPPPRPGLR